MKLLLILEHHFYKDTNGDVWCERIIDYSYLKRYLAVFETVYVCARADKNKNNLTEFHRANGEGILFLELPDFTGPLRGIILYPEMKRCLRKYLKLVDCVLLRAPSIVSVMLYECAKSSGKPLALEMVMAADKLFVSDTFTAKRLNVVVERYVKKMCFSANGVAYVTKYKLQNKYPCRAMSEANDKYFTGSYSSIDLEQSLVPEFNRQRIEKPEIVKIIHTGYMDDDRKGQSVVIKAVKILNDRGYNVSGTLIGDGIKRKHLEKLVQDLSLEKKIIFTGAIRNKTEILDKLSHADIFVMPTQSEGLPRSILEAMAVGLPCITSDVDGIPELLEPEFMLSTFEPVQYADKIEGLLINWREAVRTGQRNYMEALNYTKQNLDKKRTEFYLQLAQLAEKH